MAPKLRKPDPSRRSRATESRAAVAAEEEAPSESAAMVVDDSGPEDAPVCGHQLARRRLRQRWELASVLNFLKVFEPLLESDLELSAEEIEDALISPNDNLGRIHLALLKGITPIKKNVSEPDAWITFVCKQLDSWWPWVAEGEIPLKADRGEEIRRYKGLDPTIRLQILKALCEVRADQYDVSGHINDELKAGAKITTFRKEPISRDSNGVTYWYDGDPVIGHRLYKEIFTSDLNRKAKGERMSIPSFQWEILATNLEEFREISENLSTTMGKEEIAVRKTIEIEILPPLEELQKKKERRLKRQQRQAILLERLQTFTRFETNRPRRERKPVCYTFEEYDRSIKEAIQMTMKENMQELQKDGCSYAEHAPRKIKYRSYMDKENIVPDSDFEDVENQIHSPSDGETEDNCSIDDSAYIAQSEESDKEEVAITRQTRQGLCQRRDDAKQKMVTGVFRNTRAAANIINDNEYHPGTHANMKKRLRERPTLNPTYSFDIASDSEDSITVLDRQSRRRQ